MSRHTYLPCAAAVLALLLSPLPALAAAPATAAAPAVTRAGAPATASSSALSKPTALPTAPPPTSAADELPASGRDPMQWPAALRAAAAAEALAATGPASAPEADSAAPRLLIFRDGQASLMQGNRRLGVGDKLGEARIVRIDQHAIWLREAGVVRREPLFAGVELRPSAASDNAASAPVGKAPKRKNNKSVSKDQP